MASIKSEQHAVNILVHQDPARAIVDKIDNKNPTSGGTVHTVSTPPPERFRQLIASKLITLSKVDKTNIILIANN